MQRYFAKFHFGIETAHYLPSLTSSHFRATSSSQQDSSQARHLPARAIGLVFCGCDGCSDVRRSKKQKWCLTLCLDVVDITTRTGHWGEVIVRHQSRRSLHLDGRLDCQSQTTSKININHNNNINNNNINNDNINININIASITSQ